MAMSVVEQPVTERVPRSPRLHLALSSFAGAAYVLLSLWAIFGGLPYVWGYLPLANPFLSSALLLIATLLAGMGLWYVGYRLERAHARHGLRAGVFFASVFIYVMAWL